ncbi:MAG: hypothetical protein EHM27_06370 [Deltaproteobacteria bacterium]|nr:MAG: hypothetical protein EHM27_06370 [Deltaproteobacteria bacterium]
MRDNQEGGGCSENIEKAPIGPPGTIKKFGSAARLFRPSKTPRIIPPREKTQTRERQSQNLLLPPFSFAGIILKKILMPMDYGMVKIFDP